ncbi:SMP-30/gluconolactonase/LRE family protein [Pseudoduganella lutea]|nr:SMP-30/gluconolactonase/LRE family protein [Pseudoduganella lutea]
MSRRLQAGLEVVSHMAALVGEGAVWCTRSSRLLWVDAWANAVLRYDPVTGAMESWVLPQRTGCVAPASDGGILVGLQSGYWRLDPGSGAVDAVLTLDHADYNRCNDSVVDPFGRFWCGTMNVAGLNGPRTGELFGWDGHGQPVRRLEGLGLSNGLACSPDGRILYFSDSHPAVNRVWQYDLDGATGALSNRRLFFDTALLPGRPDGATVDADGCYWIAAVDGWAVLRITPDGRVDRRIELPVAKPSKVAIGGARLDTLFITSISATLDPSQRAAQPLAGHLFAVHVGPIGVAQAEVRLQG